MNAWRRIRCPRLAAVFFCSGLALLLAAALCYGVQGNAPQPFQEITVVSDDNYPPYIFRDRQGTLQGIVVDQWNLWQQKTGIKVNVVGMDWGKAQHFMAEGKADVIDTPFFTEKRAEVYDFTKPYATVEVPVFFDKRIGGITDADSLHGFTVGVKEGDACIEVLQQHGIATLKEFPSYEAVIQAAGAGNIKVFCVDKPPALHYLHKMHLENEYWYTTPLYVGQFHRAVAKGKKELLACVESGFSKITAGEYMAVEKKWMGSPPLMDSPRFRVIVYSAVVALLLALVLIIWNRTLRGTVAIRTSQLQSALESLQRSEEEFKALAEDSRDVIMRFDSSFRHLYVNPAVTQMTGIPREQFIGKTHRELGFPEDLVQVWERAIGVVFETKRTHRVELTMANDTCIDLVLAPEFGFAGEVNAIVTSARDITERKRAEELLRNSEERLRATLESTADGILAVDDKGHVIFANRRFAEMWHIPPDLIEEGSDEELLAFVLEQLVDPEGFLAKVRELYASLRDDFDTLLFRDGRAFERYSRPLTREDRIIGRVWSFRDATERRRSAQALQDSEAKYRMIVENLNDALYIHDFEGAILDVNENACKMLGYAREELVGATMARVDSAESMRHFPERLEQLLRQGAVVFEAEHARKDGRLVPVEVSAKVVTREGKGVVQAFVRDIAERKQAEEERQRLQEDLAQAQKMEAIGQLAGGVAHDFNNLLQVITGNMVLALRDIQPGGPTHESLTEVMKATDRATSLVRQLLVFSRKSELRLERADLNVIADGLMKMVGRIIGEHIDLRLHPEKGLKTIYADPGQMEQVIMNLCVNARDAMPKGGDLTIETRNVHLDAEDCQHHVDAREGDYVLLSVSDTGTGIPEEAYEHIFEPFFTTKGVGKGTGLGLATVYAIVKRHGGFIDFSSGGGRGATFRIYLPVFEGAEETAETGSKGYRVTPLGHGNTLLFAEDDEQVRRLITGVLERAGYRVLSARDGEEALVVFEQHANEIDLALLDVVMPKRTGLAVLDVIRRSRPEIPVLFSSGYSADVLGSDLTERNDFELIRKPFQEGDLLNRIGRLIERKPSPP